VSDESRRQRISYAEVLRQISDDYRFAPHRTAALTSLAALIEGCEQWRNAPITAETDPSKGARLIAEIAAGFDPHAEGGK
jgi:hypothetical protein